MSHDTPQRAHRLRRTAARTGARLGVLMLAFGATLAPGGVAHAATTVQPYVTCYWHNSDGSFTLDIGYTNSTGSTLTYPVGPLNYVTPSPQDRGQPTVFYPGTHDNVWAPTISRADLASGADWTVNGAKASANIGKITMCTSKPIPIEGAPSGVVLATAVIILVGGFGLRPRPKYLTVTQRLHLPQRPFRRRRTP